MAYSNEAKLLICPFGFTVKLWDTLEHKVMLIESFVYSVDSHEQGYS